MTLLTAYHTDVGIRKQTNQDALLIKTATAFNKSIGFFVVCDGMGGLSHGELASATVVRGLSDWFEQDLPELVEQNQLDDETIQSALKDRINELNEKIMEYGRNSRITLGTTLTAFLSIDSVYYIIQIGDSRAYCISNNLEKLTEDQTLVARELARGNITEEQARVDKRRNVLLQCVGATEELDIVFSKGELDEHAVYMLCSDGLYHEVSDKELVEQLHPSSLQDESKMQDQAIQLVQTVKNRKEPDNISILLFKAND